MAKRPVNFMEIGYHKFLRVAAISPVVHLANPLKCGDELLKWVRKAYTAGAQVIVAPELFMSGGYTIQDLHHDQTIHAKTDQAIATFLKKTKQLDAMVAFGSSIVINSMLFNVMYVTLRGEVLGIITKSLLPNGGEFTEQRWFKPTSELPLELISKFGQEILVGNDLIFVSQDNPLLALAGEICQDKWSGVRPVSFLVHQGAMITFSAHASNYQVGKHDWRRHLSRRGGDDIAADIYAGSGDGESTMGVVFDNPLLISDRGEIIADAKLFQVGGAMEIADINLGAIANDRMRDTNWSQNAAMFKGVLPARRIYFSGELGCPDKSVYHTFHRKFDTEPFVPKTEEERENLFRSRMIGLRRRLLHLPPSQRKIVLGLSGGKDSASVLMVMIAVVDEFGAELGMTRQDIHCITMPGFGTSAETYDYASNLARVLGTSFYVKPIHEQAKLAYAQAGHPGLEEIVHTLPPNSALTLLFENVQVRERKQTELDFCQAIGGICLGSTSASEALIGWFTLFGDGSAHYAPNAGMGKSAVKSELEWLAQVKYANDPELSGILLAIARSISSPELLRLSADKKVVQKSEEINGPDTVRDFYANYLLRFHNQPSTIYRFALHAYSGVHKPKELYDWLERFLRRLAENWYKLNMQSIDTVKVGAVAPGAHDFTKLPSDFKPMVWLEDLDTIPLEYRSKSA